MNYRVVYLDHVARLSGGEIALLRTLTALSGQVDAHVILGEAGPLVDEMRGAGIAVEVLPMAAGARDVRKDTIRPGRLRPAAVTSTAAYVWKVRHRLKELQPDLVHTNSLKAAIYGGLAGRLAGIPVIWHIRDRISDDYLPTYAVGMVRAAARLLPATIVANSRSTLSTLPGRISGTVVANAVVYDAVPSAPAPPDPSQRPYRVAIVGRLAPWKGQGVFLEAFAEAFGPDTGCEAWVIGSAMFGEGDYANSLQVLADRLGVADRVVFRGFRHDIWADLAQVDVLVHSSLIPEPFGQVVVEGLAAGVPVIAANAGGPAEIIRDGVDGLLTEPGDPHELASAMKRVRMDPDLRRRLVDAGLVTAAKYSPEQTARQMLAVYEQTLQRG